MRAYCNAQNVAQSVHIAKAQGTPPSGDGKTVRIAGELTRIDGKALAIGGTVVTCNDATKVSRDGGGQASFSDLQVGQQVRAYCTPSDLVAQTIHIAGAAASGTAK